MKKIIILSLLCAIEVNGLAQCIAADFTVPSNTCLSQDITVTTPDPYSSYEWDFCPGDLYKTPVTSIFQSSAGGAFSVELAEQNGNYFGFYTSRTTHKLYRLDFNSDINSNPIPVDLGDLGIGSSGWLSIEIVKEGGIYYGFIIDFSNIIYRLSFGSSLTNQPQNIEIIYQNGLLSNPIGLTLVDDESGKFAFVVNFSSANIVRLNFGGSYTSTSGVIAIDNIAVTGSGNLAGISFIRECNLWYAVTSSFPGGQISKLTFNNGLTDTAPSVIQLATLASPTGIALTFEDGKYSAFVQSYLSPPILSRLDFGPSMSNSSPTLNSNIGDFTSVGEIWGFSMHKVNSDWLVLASENTGNKIVRIGFPNACLVANQYSTNRTATLTTQQVGTFDIALTVQNNLGFKVTTVKSVTILDTQPPSLDFNYDNKCVNASVNFTPVTNFQGNVSYNWDFGNGSTSTQTNPTSTFSSASGYFVSLRMTTLNDGCYYKVNRTIPIYNSPISSFDIPSVSPLCTNQTYSYTNSTKYDNGSNPTWQWSVNGTNVATTQDLNYLFTSSSAQSITLTASIPGCSSQSTQDVSTLVDGPLVTFDSPTTGCKGSSISFTNTTFGTITSQTWSFGDGDGSTQSNVSHTYSTTGVFPVSLSTTNAAGCQNSLSKNLSIYSVPQTDFAIEAPPLSCERSPSQFDNLTPALTDSNISSWTWNFGDAVSGTSTLKNPSYTYMSAGNYSVSLQATSNFGCSKSVQKSITIYSSPTAGFTNSVACVNQSTRFNDASTGAVSFYQWTVQNNILAGATPVYTFKSSGVFPITLTVTSSNGCTNQVSKNVTVPVLPVIDFIVQRPCTGNPSAFQELNAGGADPAVAWNWNFGQGSSTGSPASYQFPLEGGYTVTMSTTRQSGCVYSASKNISISKGPVAKFTPSVFAGAAPLYVSFTNSSTADSYMWNFGDAAQTTSAVTSPSFTYLSLGKYKALLTAKNNLGCSDTLSTEIDVVVPHIDIAMNGFSLTIDPASNTSKPIVTILNSGNIPLIDPTVVIDLGGGASIKEKISGMVRPGKSFVQTLGLQIIPSSLQYICAEIDVADDVNSENNKQCVSLSAEDVILNPYPNPSSSGQITLEWVGSAQESAQITVFGSNGEIVFEQHLDSVQTGLGQFSLRTSSLSNGLYLIRFAGSKTTKIFKVVIAN